ncbi:DUF6541 family protein [Microbacterium sp. HMH0099]|uniref:DUF6541 family protein n=1 Tax=Microbacterium sp. HMH0099 TaxID=3414026 RepID=UPI003BF69B75
MSGSWLTALPSIAVALAAVLLPGILIRLAGWNVRDVLPWLLVPAMSVTVLAVASNVAHFVRLPWSPLPVALVAVLIAAVAFVVRRVLRAGEVVSVRPTHAVGMTVALAVSALAIGVQLVVAFGRPDAISQTLDNIVHLNAIKLATDTADASAVQIGATSDIPFYPNGWHSIVALVQLLTGAPIPVAVTAANIVIGAVVWPFSAAALAWAVFRRPLAVVFAALLATGFGAFPLLLLDFGVLYPNFAGYALIGAALAAVWPLVQASGWRERVRPFLLLLLISVGVGISHPNALLGVFALAVPAVVLLLVPFTRAERTRGRFLALAVVTLGLLVIGYAVWTVARTNYDMSRWGPWQTASQAVGEALTLAPRQFPMTIVLALLLAVGAVVIARRPARLPAAGPFLAALVLFVLCSGAVVANPIREFLANPWYNDPYRLAALLPVAAIPLVTLGALAVSDGLRACLGRLPGASAWAPVAAVAVVTALAASVAVGQNVRATIVQTQGQYALRADANVLSEDELDVLTRLDETTPPDAVIVGSPLTGASLAYAIGDRTVTERHVFGTRTPDEQYLTENLRDIDSDPEVCEAVRAVGATYVLDFGDRTVNGNDGSAYTGLEDLQPSARLVLVDSEGPDAKLFRIEGCS